MKRILDIAGATLASLLPSSNKLSIDSYGQSSSNMTPEEIQKIMQWLFFILGERGVHGQGSSDLGCWQPDLGQTRFDWSAQR